MVPPQKTVTRKLVGEMPAGFLFTSVLYTAKQRAPARIHQSPLVKRNPISLSRLPLESSNKIPAIQISSPISRNGLIFSAGLDVTDPEPPSMDDPLLTLPNVVIAPHIASATVATRNGMAEIAADNLILGLEGKPLRCWVNPEVEPNRRQP